MAKTESDIRQRTHRRVREPRRYKVTLHNDDFTTMDFVVEVLLRVFFKSQDEAEKLMLTVHKTGQAVVGVYTYDTARSKVEKATAMARERNFPLRLSYRPE